MRRIRITLFLLVWVAAAWFGSWEFNPNNSTRLFAAIALVERHDARIDDFAALTIDKAEFGSHVYLDKAPGMTLMAMPAVALADALTGTRAAQFPRSLDDPGLARFLRLRLRLAAASGPALLTAIAAVLVFDMALALTGSAAAALFAALGYALGTPIWGWSTTIFGHAVVAALYVVAAWGGWRATTRDGDGSAALLAGAALGWAVVVEYPAVLAGIVVAAWIAWRAWPRPGRWRLLALAGAGGTLALLPLLGYNLFAFGTPFRIAYSGVRGFEGMRQGVFGLGLPRGIVLWEILFGVRRGLAWVAPVLVLAPPGLVRLARSGRRDWAWMAAAVTATVLLVNAAYVYWDGGDSTGPRHAMPLAGLLALGLAPFWASLASPAARRVAAGVLALSIAINAVVAAAEIVAPSAYRFPLWSAVVDLRFRHGDLRTLPSEWWGWSSWAGFAALAVPATLVLLWLARACGRADAGLASPPSA